MGSGRAMGEPLQDRLTFRAALDMLLDGGVSPITERVGAEQAQGPLPRAGQHDYQPSPIEWPSSAGLPTVRHALAFVAEHPGHPLPGGIHRGMGHPQGLGGPLDGPVADGDQPEASHVGA